MTTPLRPLTLGELLDRTFLLYRTHFVVFVGIAALPQLAVLAFGLVNASTGPRSAISLAGLLMSLASILLLLIVNAITQAATVVAVSELHLDRPASIGGAFAAVRGRIVGLCLIITGVGFLIGLGTLALIVPGIILFLRWSLVVPVAVLEHVGMRDAMSRSATLTKGHRGRVFMIYFLFIVLTLVFAALWELPVMPAITAAVQGGVQAPAWTQVVLSIGSFVTATLASPLMTIAFSLMYYDERVRKEAFDLEHMLSQMDRPATASEVPA